MEFEAIDRYLLGEPISKAGVIADLLARRSPLPAAAPFYRALEAVGTRAADEALIALRLVLAGFPPSDERVRRLRTLTAIARASANDDRKALTKLRRRDAAFARELGDDRDLAILGSKARAAYRSEVGLG